MNSEMQKVQRRGLCPECKVREKDSSKKILYQCSYCERRFCTKHLAPRLAVFKDFKKPVKDRHLQHIIEEARKIEGGHPDYQYTLNRLETYEFERQATLQSVTDLLDGSKAYRARKRVKNTHQKWLGRPSNSQFLPKKVAPTVQKCAPTYSTKTPAIPPDRRKGALSFVKPDTCKLHRTPPKTTKHHSTPYPPTDARVSKKRIIGVVLGLTIFVSCLLVFLWKAPLLFQQSPYKTLTVVEGQLVTVDFDGDEYYFAYKIGWPVLIPEGKFVVTTPLLRTELFDAAKGRTYMALGLEIQVSKVESDYIVLLVKKSH